MIENATDAIDYTQLRSVHLKKPSAMGLEIRAMHIKKACLSKKQYSNPQTGHIYLVEEHVQDDRRNTVCSKYLAVMNNQHK